MKLLRKLMCVMMIFATIVMFATNVNKVSGYSEVKIQNNTEKTKKKEDYIVKVKEQDELDLIKQEYRVSDEINQNAEGELEDNSLVSIELSNEEVQRIKSREDIEFVEKDYQVKACQNKAKKQHAKKEKRLKSNTSDYEWNVRMIHADSKAEDAKEHVKVAVIDSGIDWGNDINLVYQESLVPGEEEMTQVFMDGNGHGSSVASLIAATDNSEGITGINPNVDIYSYRVLGDDNSAPVSRVVESIYMAIEQKVNIINMSFGLNEYSNALEQAIKDAKEAGILIIAAAGNTGEEGVVYPAAFEEVVAVGAVNKDGDVEDYSAKGEEVEIVAPGELVRTTGFLDSEEVTSGTSLSAPQVTGVASLIWQKDLSMPAEFVRGLLDDSANLYGSKKHYGNGLLDAEYALKYYKKYKKEYEKNKTKNNEMLIESNENDIMTFEDTGCVEGCWNRNDHESMIDSSYFCVRRGVRFPDDKSYVDNGQYDAYTFAGMENNPWWHGYYKTNYIKAVIYATKMADVIGEMGKGKQSCASTINYGDAGKMLADINKMDSANIWNIELNYMKNESRYKGNAKVKAQTDSKSFRRAFVWGMAIHSATDIYAHSVRYNGKHLIHKDKDKNGNPQADSKDICGSRFNDAKKIAEKMMKKYLEGKILTVKDLIPSTGISGYKLYKLYDYVNSLDKDYAATIKKYSY